EKGRFLVQRRPRRAGDGLDIRLESTAHGPVAMAQGARELQEVSADAGSGELQPGPGHGTAQEGAEPPEPIVDRHPRIDNDGGRLSNGPPASPQQIDIASTIGEEL